MDVYLFEFGSWEYVVDSEDTADLYIKNVFSEHIYSQYIKRIKRDNRQTDWKFKDVDIARTVKTSLKTKADV